MRCEGVGHGHSTFYYFFLYLAATSAAAAAAAFVTPRTCVFSAGVQHLPDDAKVSTLMDGHRIRCVQA